MIFLPKIFLIFFIVSQEFQIVDNTLVAILKYTNNDHAKCVAVVTDCLVSGFITGKKKLEEVPKDDPDHYRFDDKISYNEEFLVPIAGENFVKNKLDIFFQTNLLCTMTELAKELHKIVHEAGLSEKRTYYIINKAKANVWKVDVPSANPIPKLEKKNLLLQGPGRGKAEKILKKLVNKYIWRAKIVDKQEMLNTIQEAFSMASKSLLKRKLKVITEQYSGFIVTAGMPEKSVIRSNANVKSPTSFYNGIIGFPQEYKLPETTEENVIETIRDDGVAEMIEKPVRNALLENVAVGVSSFVVGIAAGTVSHKIRLPVVGQAQNDFLDPHEFASAPDESLLDDFPSAPQDELSSLGEQVGETPLDALPRVPTEIAAPAGLTKLASSFAGIGLFGLIGASGGAKTFSKKNIFLPNEKYVHKQRMMTMTATQSSLEVNTKVKEMLFIPTGLRPIKGIDQAPIQIQTECNRELCPRWTNGSWSECSRFCGGGIRLRHVACRYLNGTTVNPAICANGEKKEKEMCNKHQCTEWHFRPLDQCSESMELEFAVAVDLGAFSGDVKKPISLHMNGQFLNHYQRAINMVLEICERYNHNKQFEALGFGAKIPPVYHISHMFPLRLNSAEQTVHGVSGMLDAYRFALMNTQRYGPTNLEPTIRAFLKKCKEFPRDGSKFQILLILTDCIIADIQKTMEAIIEASHQPISIIIIGIGDDDEYFENMKMLDSDNQLLSYNGRTAMHDIVEFVQFRHFAGKMWSAKTEDVQENLKSALAREILAKLPDQVTTFMSGHRVPCRPNIIPAVQLH